MDKPFIRLSKDVTSPAAPTLILGGNKESYISFIKANITSCIDQGISFVSPYEAADAKTLEKLEDEGYKIFHFGRIEDTFVIPSPFIRKFFYPGKDSFTSKLIAGSFIQHPMDVGGSLQIALMSVIIRYLETQELSEQTFERIKELVYMCSRPHMASPDITEFDNYFSSVLKHSSMIEDYILFQHAPVKQRMDIAGDLYKYLDSWKDIKFDSHWDSRITLNEKTAVFMHIEGNTWADRNYYTALISLLHATHYIHEEYGSLSDVHPDIPYFYCFSIFDFAFPDLYGTLSMYLGSQYAYMICFADNLKMASQIYRCPQYDILEKFGNIVFLDLTKEIDPMTQKFIRLRTGLRLGQMIEHVKDSLVDIDNQSIVIRPDHVPERTEYTYHIGGQIACY